MCCGRLCRICHIFVRFQEILTNIEGKCAFSIANEICTHSKKVLLSLRMCLKLVASKCVVILNSLKTTDLNN